jgi:hypothetical protein
MGLWSATAIAEARVACVGEATKVIGHRTGPDGLIAVGCRDAGTAQRWADRRKVGRQTIKNKHVHNANKGEP